jgi:hypothetical protein
LPDIVAGPLDPVVVSTVIPAGGLGVAAAEAVDACGLAATPVCVSWLFAPRIRYKVVPAGSTEVILPVAARYEVIGISNNVEFWITRFESEAGTMIPAGWEPIIVDELSVIVIVPVVL